MSRKLRSPQSVFLTTLATGLFATVVAFPALLATVPLMAVATGDTASGNKPAAAGSTATANKDGRLDKVEFAKALANLDLNK